MPRNRNPATAAIASLPRFPKYTEDAVPGDLILGIFCDDPRTPRRVQSSLCFDKVNITAELVHFPENGIIHVPIEFAQHAFRVSVACLCRTDGFRDIRNTGHPEPESGRDG